MAQNSHSSSCRARFYNAVGASVLSILASSGNNYISFGTQAAGTAGLTAQVGTALLSAGQAVSFTAKYQLQTGHHNLRS